MTLNQCSPQTGHLKWIVTLVACQDEQDVASFLDFHDRCGSPPPRHRTGDGRALRDVSGRLGESGNRPALSHHQQVVVLIRDAREVAECLTHALAEGVDRRAKGVIGIQSER